MLLLLLVHALRRGRWHTPAAPFCTRGVLRAQDVALQGDAAACQTALDSVYASCYAPFDALMVNGTRRTQQANNAAVQSYCAACSNVTAILNG